ncbi:MAG: nicotinate-nucleotide--dimethylbenzimidazole phosphoribosyltransferase, partial [Proteobacteria bacterium]|nr:nicotinate-nucleotide--dimethylbenzimidazole phosphoribosyltransferase [Pseudomonadota bacterium]
MERELNALIEGVGPLDARAMQTARDRQDQLTKPRGAMGLLEGLSVQMAGVQGRSRPVVKDKVIFTLAGDHGVAREGVSAYPAEVTPQMVFNFLAGGAGINVMARQVGARVVVADMGVDHDFDPDRGPVDMKVARGTDNMILGPAMSRENAIRSILAGAALVEAEAGAGLDAIGTGDMGIGNTTPSSAITAVMTGRPVREVTGRGTGLDDRGLEAKVALIEKALAVNRPNPADPLDILAKVGGFEIGGI